MGDAERMLRVLSDLDRPICDDCVTELVGWARRQSANIAARSLANQGTVARGHGTCCRCGKLKLVTSMTNGPAIIAVPAANGPPAPAPIQSHPDRPWYWEGNVQSFVAKDLLSRGYVLHRQADTSTKEQGVDVVAERGGRELWVTVKGYPQGTCKTNPSTQSRHWFSHALFDIVLYRSQPGEKDLAVGLPDGFATYRNLAARVGWLKDTAPFTFFWVGEDGSVRSD